MLRKSIPGKELVPLIKETLLSGNDFKLLVTGTSMNPFLGNNRDSVLLTAVSNISIKKGDIVFIQRLNQEYVLHRIIKVIPNGYYVLNGDSQTWTETVQKDQIFACVRTLYRKGRVIQHDNKIYIFLSHLWMLLIPVRPIIFKLWSIINKISLK